MSKQSKLTVKADAAQQAAYAPFLDSLHLAHRKRHIHQVTVTIGELSQYQRHSLSALIKPHRSRDFTLDLHFRISSTTLAPNLIKVKLTTLTRDRPVQGALGDAMMLVAEIVAGWTTIAEEINND